MTLGGTACRPTHPNSRQMNNPKHFCFITFSQTNGGHYNTGRQTTRMPLTHFRLQAAPSKEVPPGIIP